MVVFLSLLTANNSSEWKETGKYESDVTFRTSLAIVSELFRKKNGHTQKQVLD